MHILKDENGNPIAHGGHDHAHHDHEHSHADSHCHTDGCEACEASGEQCKDETLALLSYMIQHNTHHAAETDEMANRLEQNGMADVAKQMREGVSAYQKGNMYLSVALTLYKEHLKEQH